MDVENLKQINFRQPVPEYFPWPSAGEHVPEMTNLIRKLSRNLTANVAGIKQGVFYYNSDVHHKVSRSLVFTQMFGSPQNTISDAQIAAARRMEYGAVRVVAAPEESNDGLVFYLSQLLQL